MKIGIIAPPDFALASEYAMWLPGAIFQVAFTPQSVGPITAAKAEELSDPDGIYQAALELVPFKPDVTLYACCSASFINGETDILYAMKEAGLGRNCITASGAIIDYLDFLNVDKIAVGAPYNEHLTRGLAYFLKASGFDVVNSAFLGLETGIAGVDHYEVESLIRKADWPDAEAVFLSCTNLHTFGLVETMNRLLSKPVVSANQILCAEAARMANNGI